MNRKGFTLIELLAVLVILAVVMLIGTSSMTAIQRNIHEQMFNTKLTSIITAAKKYGEDNKDLFIDASGRATVRIDRTLNDLISSKYLDTSETYPGLSPCLLPVRVDGKQQCAAVINPVDDSVINTLTVTIYMENNRVYACIPITSNINNKNLLQEQSCYKSGTSWLNCSYGDLNYYCS